MKNKYWKTNHPMIGAPVEFYQIFRLNRFGRPYGSPISLRRRQIGVVTGFKVMKFTKHSMTHCICVRRSMKGKEVLVPFDAYKVIDMPPENWFPVNPQAEDYIVIDGISINGIPEETVNAIRRDMSDVLYDAPRDKSGRFI